MTYLVQAVDDRGNLSALEFEVTDAGVPCACTAEEEQEGLPPCPLQDPPICAESGVGKEMAGTVDVEFAAASPADPDAGNNQEMATTAVETSADLSIAKSAPAVAEAGEELVYTITVTNAGPSDAQGVTVADTLPSGVSGAESDDCDDDPAGGASCDLGTIAAGASRPYTITVTVDPGASGTLINQASVSAITADPEVSNNQATAVTALEAAADLSIAKSAPATAVADEELTYTVTVSNAGPADALGVTVIDDLPGELLGAESSGCANDPGGAAVCDLETIAAGSAKQYTITATVDPGARGTLTNSASVLASSEDPEGGNNQATAVTVLAAAADLSLAKSAPAVAVAGEELFYTLTVTNAGPSDAQGVTVADTLPAAVSGALSSGCLNDPGGGASCEVGTIAAGDSRQYTITVTVDPAASGSLINQASVSALTADPDGGDNQATAVTALEAAADLSLVKSAPGSAEAGEELVYTLTVTNAGPSDALGVTVADTLPAAVSGAVSSGCDNDPGGGASCELGAIAAGASRQYTITVTIDPGATGTLINQASVGAVTADPEAGDNQATAVTALEAVANLSLAKSAPAVAVAGKELTCTLTVTNAGPSDATGVTARGAERGGVERLRQRSGGAVIGDLGTIVAGSAKQYTITATVDPGASGELVKSAIVLGSSSGNDQATAVTALQASADLALGKSAPAVAVAGEELTYTLTVTNAGPSDALGVTVTDTLPSEVSGAVSSGCENDPAGGSSCALGTLAAGAVRQVTITVTVDSGASGTLLNQASVGATTTDPEVGDNQATAVTVLGASADLSIGKSAPPTVVAGEELTYTVTVTNAGPSDAFGVTVVDTLPEGLSGAVSSGCANDPSGARWSALWVRSLPGPRSSTRSPPPSMPVPAAR